MHLDLLQSLSLAGDASVPNDDRAGLAARHAWVIDGATDLGPPGLVGDRGGAAWLAGHADAAFAASADGPVEQLFAEVAGRLVEAFGAARTRAPEGRWELPLAAALVVRFEGAAVECGWLGDCVALLGRPDGGVIRLGPLAADRVAETARARRLAAHGLGAVKRSAPILADLRASRGQSGKGVFGVDPDRIAVPEVRRAACAPGDDLLLMTDGFAALIDAYRTYDEAGLFAAVRARGLAAVGAELRAIEAGDPRCERFPRFKRCDDATALWLRVGGAPA